MPEAAATIKCWPAQPTSATKAIAMYMFRFIFLPALPHSIFIVLSLAIIAGKQGPFNEEGITRIYLLCIAVSL
jgi:hypothetical protein